MSARTLAAPAARPLTGGKVLAIMLGFFGIIAAANVFLVTSALKTWSGLDEASPYQASQRYNAELASARAQEALGWSVEAKAMRDGPEDVAITVAMRDRSGRVLDGVVARAILERPIDKRLDRKVELAPTAPGALQGHLTQVPSGQWDLLVDLERDGERVFRRQTRVILP